MSFVANVMITLIAIVNGYLSDSLSESTLTQLDREILSKIKLTARQLWRSNGIVKTLVRPSVAIVSAVTGFKFLGSNDDEAIENIRTKELRSKGLERFILALRGQQLVTGLAVLIAGNTRLCTRSIYHFKIILALAWFSSTTHLSTVAVLRVYLTCHPKIRD